MSLGDNVAPVFRQLGIYEEFCNVSIPNNFVYMHDENAVLDYAVDFTPRTAL
jgi:hypothetical protein